MLMLIASTIALAEVGSGRCGKKAIYTANAGGNATIAAACGGFVSENENTEGDKEKQEIVFGYSDNHVKGVIGSKEIEMIKCAICLPSSFLSRYKGCTITGVEALIAEEVTQLVPVVSDGGQENFATQEGTKGEVGWNEMKLVNPYVIDAEKDLYVGYECLGAHPIAHSGVQTEYGTYIYNDDSWIDYSSRGWGAFCILVHIEGYDLPVDVSLTIDQAVECGAGQTVSLQANVQNFTPEKLETLKLGYYIDNEYMGSKEVSLDVKKGNVGTASFSITAPASSGNYNLKIEVEEVNGKKDEVADNNTATIPMAIAGKTFGRKVVIEEGTGTWCGWCVRGYLGMKEMAEKYPDNFIGIAVHDGDEMANAENYEGLLGYFLGFPMCIANRDTKYLLGAFPYEMEDAILAMKDNAIAEIKAEMYVLDNDTTELLIKTHTEFGFDTSTPYRIAYAVVENGVGPYAQENFYSGSETPMGGFENQDKEIAMMYNDVARGIYGSFNGVEGSVPASVKEGQIYDYDYRLRLPSNVKCKSNVEVVALLINQITGGITNAYKCRFNPNADAITGIENATNSQVEVYSLGGFKQNALRRGVNIVRMSDGTVRKVIQK